MTDHTAGGGLNAPHHPARAPRAEFYTYFALILLLATPVSLVTWVWRLVADRRLPAQGPMARAWADAAAITPTIFRA